LMKDKISIQACLGKIA